MTYRYSSHFVLMRVLAHFLLLNLNTQGRELCKEKGVYLAHSLRDLRTSAQLCEGLLAIVQYGRWHHIRGAEITQQDRKADGCRGQACSFSLMIFFYLIERVVERGVETDSSICWLISQMATIARTDPVGDQGSGIHPLLLSRGIDRELD